MPFDTLSLWLVLALLAAALWLAWRYLCARLDRITLQVTNLSLDLAGKDINAFHHRAIQEDGDAIAKGERRTI